MPSHPMNRWSRGFHHDESHPLGAHRGERREAQLHGADTSHEDRVPRASPPDLDTRTGAMPSGGGDDRTGDYVGYGLPYEHERSEPRRAGKPPKNYTRSDERIHDEICERLAAHGADWSEIEVKVERGEVTLVGVVPSRALKLEAEHTADAVHGVNDITNCIRVQRGEAPPAGTGSGEPAPPVGDASNRRASRPRAR